MIPTAPQRLVFACVFGLCWLLPALSACADTLYFQPSLDSQGNITEAWSSLENWYFALSPMPVPANRYPGSGDTVYIVLSEYACIVDVPSVQVNALITEANIIGGNFTVQTINSTDTTFNGSTLNVENEWTSSGDQLTGATVNIMSGALLFVDGATLYVNDNSTLYDVGQIELQNGAVLEFGASSGSATNQITVTSNAQFTSFGNNQVLNTPGDPLTFDNNGTVQSSGGTLYIESDSVFWTNSLGEGYFSDSTSNSVIEVNGPFAVQPGCTNFISGPGTFELYNDPAATIDGLLQVGLSDPSPGTVDFHGNILNGTGAINFTGSPGAPSSLIWESGTLGGPTINIDTNSLLIITNNNFSKNVTGCVINNAGAATWLGDGDTIEMDNGAIFNNLGTFTAENTAVLQGGGGTNASFFYNAGVFHSFSSDSISFTEDNPPAPSVYFLNLGELDVETGAVYLEWGTNSGRFNVAQGAQLHFWLGTNVQNVTASFTGPGLFAIDSGDFWLATNLAMADLQMELNGKIDGPGNLTITGLLTLASGTVQGAGSLNIGSNALLDVVTNGVTLARNLTNGGAATISNVGVLAAQPLTWVNLPGSSLNLVAASLGNTVGYSGLPPELINAGTLSNSGPVLDTVTINWTVTNSGVVVVNPYALDFDQSLTQTAGNIMVQTGAMLSVSSSYGNLFQLQGGVLEGQGTVSAAIINSGTIHPGDSPGILTVGYGTLTNEPGAALAIDIAGTTPGQQYSQLNASGGQAWLNNLTLAVTLDNGFVPTVGQSFVIWTNQQINGVFVSIAGAQAGGVVLVPQYAPNMVTLVAANNPVIQSLSFTNRTLSFSFQTTTGLTNIIEFTPSLSPPNWQPLTNIVGNGMVQFVTNHMGTNGSQFYRVAFK